jgi:hypothetical protein
LWWGCSSAEDDPGYRGGRLWAAGSEIIPKLAAGSVDELNIDFGILGELAHNDPEASRGARSGRFQGQDSVFYGSGPKKIDSGSICGCGPAFLLSKQKLEVSRGRGGVLAVADEWGEIWAIENARRVSNSKLEITIGFFLPPSFGCVGLHEREDEAEDQSGSEAATDNIEKSQE